MEEVEAETRVVHVAGVGEPKVVDPVHPVRPPAFVCIDLVDQRTGPEQGAAAVPRLSHALAGSNLEGNAPLPTFRWLYGGNETARRRRFDRETGENANRTEGVGFEPTEALRLQRFSRWHSAFAKPRDFELSRTFALSTSRLIPPRAGSCRPVADTWLYTWLYNATHEDCTTTPSLDRR